jgi:hypothetical protein
MGTFETARTARHASRNNRLARVRSRYLNGDAGWPMSTFYMCQVPCMALQSAISRRCTTLDRCRFRHRMDSLNDLPSARLRLTYALVSSSVR